MNDAHRPETVGQVLEDIRRTSTTEYEKGKLFEELFKRVALRDPGLELTDIWDWAEWPQREEWKNLGGFSAEDIGIDLVAQHASGAFIAIQCKCLERRVAISDLKAFPALAQRKPFELGWLVTASDWTRNVEKLFSEHIRKIDFIGRYGDTPYVEEAPKRYEPRPAQQEAIRHCIEGLAEHDRGRLIMACGTGKTFTALQIAEDMVADGGHILFLAPSIALVSQARSEWLQQTRRVLNTTVVCSDSTASRGREDTPISELVCPVTTDANRIAEQMQGAPPGATVVVFCTYQSLSCVIEAQAEHNGPIFDLTVADEAHRTTGIVRQGERKVDFQAVHDGDRLRSTKRLYMTATPRIYTEKSKAKRAGEGYQVVDMSDEDCYGPELNRLTFKTAVNENLLSDYRVIVLGVDRGRITPGLRRQLDGVAKEVGNRPGAIGTSEWTRIMGVALAINGATVGDRQDRPDGPLMRSLAFANSILRSKSYAGAMQNSEFRRAVTRNLEGGMRFMEIEATHLDASASALQRNRELRNLKLAGTSPDHKHAKMLCNVKLFSEGVDVPSLDAVAFLDPRQSQVDIVQAVGRVMRKSEAKRFGYIIVPVVVEPGQDMLEALERGTDGYRVVGKVLRALQSHDGRLNEDTARFVQIYHEKPRFPGGGEVRDWDDDELPGQFELELDVQQGIYAQVAKASGLGEPGRLTANQIEDIVRVAGAGFHKEGAAPAIEAALGFARDSQAARRTCTIGALLLANACLLHRRLSDTETLKTITQLDDIGRSSAPVEMLETAWRGILRKDYRPVFLPAIAVLAALPESEAVDRALRRIASEANGIADSLSELGYDHAGPLYHRILGSAKSDGAFYTRNTSALLLARLALNVDFTDWSSGKTVRNLRILDPACGTGTLLMAALRTIKDRVADAKVGEGEKKRRKRELKLHRRLVEDAICGMDINRYGVQLAACNLTLGAPSVDYRQMNLHTLRHGRQDDGAVQCGSLEFLATADQSDELTALVRPLRSFQAIGAQQVDKSQETNFPLWDLDMVIMNPPFTENTKRGGKFDKATRSAMQERELWIRNEVASKDIQAGGVITTNSVRSFFSPLADRLLDKSTGTLASVVPVAACVGADGLAERKFLAERFQIELIVTSHDPRQIAFSENTSIHECLLVCRRRQGSTIPPTEFVSLRQMPGNAEEAIKAANAIVEGRTEQWGSSYLWPAELVRGGDWTPAQWYDGNLAEIVRELETHEGLVPAKQVLTTGATGQAAQDSWKRETNSGTSQSVLVFDSVSAKKRRTMLDTPDQPVVPGGRRAHLHDRVLQSKGNLMLATRYNTVSGRLTALWSKVPTFGFGWIPAKGADQAYEQAICAWWNSTPGRLLLLNRRGKTLTYPKWSVNHLTSVPCPSPKTTDYLILTKAWQQACQTHLRPMRQAENCTARQIIDKAAAQVIGIEPRVLADWRHGLASEPTVTNRQAHP
ncbi:MAG: DEAD/DEAH box helicase family protein [Albidovulum sp.]|nr:DEAD/DEAH box helicase family protein [Albidovulum sp.]